jgi:hypothetical protein
MVGQNVGVLLIFFLIIRNVCVCVCVCVCMCFSVYVHSHIDSVSLENPNSTLNKNFLLNHLFSALIATSLIISTVPSSLSQSPFRGL